jgi:hypothetical protein
MNVLRAAFADSSTVFFALSGSARAKAGRRTLMKLTLGVEKIPV